MRRPIELGAVVLAVAFAAGLYFWRVNTHTTSGVLTQQGTEQSSQDTSYYLKTDEGFDNVRPVAFRVPFKLQRAEWQIKDGRTLLVVQFTNPISAEVWSQAGFCLEILANGKRTIIWLGRHLRPKLAPDLKADEALIANLDSNRVEGYGQAHWSDKQVEVVLPAVLESVDVVYLRYVPSEQAYREGGLPMIVSALRAGEPPPWGSRVRQLQGGYLWVDE